MSKESTSECLQTLAEAPNNKFNKTKISQEVENYVEFYHKKHKVPRQEIFLGATVSSVKLAEICENPTVTILLAKSGTSTPVNGFEEFKFIILGSDIYGNTLLEIEMILPNTDYLDAACCKRPKGGLGGFTGTSYAEATNGTDEMMPPSQSE